MLLRFRMDNALSKLVINVVSLFVAPGVLVTAVLAFVNTASKNLQRDKDVETKALIEQSKKTTVPLLAEQPPAKTIVRQVLPQDKIEKIMQYPPLDQDILFVAGEREMPLSVYESPLMNAYKRFRETKPDERADGYYVVNRKSISPNNTSEEHATDQDVMLLYGRGPVFHLKDEYANRFEGFDD